MAPLGEMPQARFTEQCEALLACCGEVVDPPLIEAARELRNAAVVCDAMNERFEAAAYKVRDLLRERIEGGLLLMRTSEEEDDGE